MGLISKIKIKRRITMNDTNTTPEFDLTFEDFIVGKPQPTLKAIAEIFDVPQQDRKSVV